MSSFQTSLIKAATKSKTAKLLSIGAVFLLLIFVGRKTIFSNNQPQTTQTQTSTFEAKMTEVNASLNIPIDEAEEKSIAYSVNTAELRKDIILQGEKYSAVENKLFLILSVKLSNEQEDRVKINSRDYVRLISTATGDRLAPSMHNDPVEVQPISDQSTRLGFLVDENETQFKLLLGEISEDKQEIEINF